MYACKGVLVVQPTTFTEQESLYFISFCKLIRLPNITVKITSYNGHCHLSAHTFFYTNSQKKTAKTICHRQIHVVFKNTLGYKTF